MPLHVDVPEITEAVNRIVNLLGQLPSSDFDRSAIFTMFFAGCMSDDTAVRAMVKHRMYAIEDTFGNIYDLVGQMEQLWRTRVLLVSQHGPAALVPWRECLYRSWENRTVLLL